MKTSILIIIMALVFFPITNIFAQMDDKLKSWQDPRDMNSLDPDLSSSYATEFTLNSIFIVLIQLSVISFLFIISHLILKKKKISSRPYVILIAAAIMLFIGIPNFIQGIMTLFMILINKHLWTVDYLLSAIPFMILGFVLTGCGLALLVKSKLIRNFIQMK